jgi:hypothetical protein
LNEDIPIGRTIDEVHLVLQAGASTADDRYSQRARRAPLFLEQRVQLSRGVLSDFNETLVADFVIDGGGRR